MKESLSELFCELIHNGHATYYKMDSPSPDILSDRDKGRSFIVNYLFKGQKDQLRISNFLYDLDSSRIRHIISCYLLGVLLYNRSESIKKGINELFKKANDTSPDNTPNNRFLYLWMLTSIFHDFGYAIEDNKQTFSKVDYSKYMKEFPRRCQSIPLVYNKEILRQYEKFRECRYNVQDHGIVGAIELYSELCKLREEKDKDQNQTLFWGKELIEDFRRASWAIACHNIFFVRKDESNVLCYKHFKLDKLIYDNDKTRKITLKEHPMLFLLCLVDSIDPIKMYATYRRTLLKDIILHFTKDSIEINYKNLCSPLKENYSTRIASINNWLTDITSTTDGTIIHL